MADDQLIHVNGRSFSESELRGQYAAGNDMSVPIDSRPATSPLVHGVVIADASRPVRRGKITSAADAVDADFSDPGSRLAKPANATVIGRATAALPPIQVQRFDAELPMGHNMVSEDAPVLPKTGAVVDTASSAPVRPGSDSIIGVASPDVQIGDSDQGINAASGRLIRQETRLTTLSPVNEGVQPPPVKVAEVTPSPTPPPPAQLQPATGQVTEAPAVAPAAQPEPQVVVREVRVQAPIERPKKQTVKISSERLGNHRVKVDFVGISDTVLVLSYIDDDDAQIFEPPFTPSDEPLLMVTVGDKTYPCAYYEFSVEMTYGPFKVFQVILARVVGK